MKCVYCNSIKTSTSNSRATRSQTQTWRRKYCTECKRSFSSFEKPDMQHLAVKKDNTVIPYRRSQLYLSIARSFQGKAINYELIDKLADTLEVKLLKLQLLTIPSNRLSQLVLETLKPIDKKAYLHYLAEHS